MWTDDDRSSISDFYARAFWRRVLVISLEVMISRWKKPIKYLTLARVFWERKNNEIHPDPGAVETAFSSGYCSWNYFNLTMFV